MLGRPWWRYLVALGDDTGGGTYRDDDDDDDDDDADADLGRRLLFDFLGLRLIPLVLLSLLLLPLLLLLLLVVILLLSCPTSPTESSLSSPA